jgi:hypothetical protein
MKRGFKTMKQKRYGKQATLAALKNGFYIAYYEWFTLNAGYKIIDKDRNIVGFITFDLWVNLLQENVITAYVTEYSSTIYGIKY